MAQLMVRNLPEELMRGPQQRAAQPNRSARHAFLTSSAEVGRRSPLNALGFVPTKPAIPIKV